MRTRILTAAALLPVVGAVYLGPGWLFLLLAVAAGLGVTWEAGVLFETRGHRPAWPAVAVSVVLVNVAFYTPAHLPPAAALAAGAAFAFGWLLLMRRDVEHAVENVGATLAVILVPAFVLAFQVALRQLPATLHGEGDRAPALLLFLYAAVFGSDAVAYFVGRAVGRTKLAPVVSPGKTVEGFVAGVVGGAVLGTGVAAVLPTGLGLPAAALSAALLCVAGVFGGMAVSLLKRGAGVKDSGRLLPGHGGLLDRLDGLLFSSPLLYLLVTGPHAGLEG